MKRLSLVCIEIVGNIISEITYCSCMLAFLVIHGSLMLDRVTAFATLRLGNVNIIAGAVLPTMHTLCVIVKVTIVSPLL